MVGPIMKTISILLAVGLAAGAALADPPKKKPLYPPPEESKTVGTLGHHSDQAPADKAPAPPPQTYAAPEVPKVESEATPLAAAPREAVQGEQPAMTAGGPSMMMRPTTPPTGFLAEHPMVSGLVAGLIGSDLGSQLYGGPMIGDRNMATVGYVLRVGLILGLAWLVFRLISNRVTRTDDSPLAGPRKRREPTFNRDRDY